MVWAHLLLLIGMASNWIIYGIRFISCSWGFPLDHKFMLQQIQHLLLDKYVKKLDSVTTAQLFIFAQLMNIESYANISIKVKTNKKLQKIIDLKSISTSQLSRKLRDMDTAFLESVFNNLVQKLFDRLGGSKAGKKLGNIH